MNSLSHPPQPTKTFSLRTLVRGAVAGVRCLPHGFEIAAGFALAVVVFVSVYHSAWWVLIALMVLRLFWITEPDEDAMAETQSGSGRRRHRRSRLQTVAMQPRRTWHFAQVLYEYENPQAPGERLIDTETVQVYGKCEESALLSLRRLYPQRGGLRVRSINRHFVEPTLD
ncbi:MAG: hypothetical protein ACO3DD_09680 [Burkholderiaceae bacterium]